MNPKSTSHATGASTSFSRRVDHSRQLTSENIQSHMAAFEAAGGRVEVLGTTRVLKHVEPEPVAPAASR